MDRRQVFFALALMGAFGCAQAAMLDWRQTAASAGETVSAATLLSEPSGTTFSVALVFTVGDTQTGGPRLTLTSSANSGAYLAVGVAGANDQGRLYRGNANTFYSRGSIHEGTNVVGIVFEVDEADGGKLALVSFNINGETFGLAEVGAEETGCYWTGGWTGTDLALDTVSFALAENGTLYFAEGAATGADFAALPEPTALAVLALGVAGAALRRRMA